MLAHSAGPFFLSQLGLFCWFQFFKRIKNVCFLSRVKAIRKQTKHGPLLPFREVESGPGRGLAFPAGGFFQHHVLREQCPCLSFYPHQLGAAHPSRDTWSGPFGSGLCHCQEPPVLVRTCCHARRLLSEQSPRCLSHGHCIARAIPHIHSSIA